MRALLLLSVAVAAVLAPVATADAATTYPSISKIDPLNLGIGERMTISGRGFLPGKNRNTVVFKRDGQRAIFAKAESATTRRLRVVVPEKLRPFLSKRDGAEVPTKFRIRVLARRFGKRYTALSASPVIAPVARTVASPKDPGQTLPTAAPPPDCDGDKIVDDLDGDDDNDHMSDVFEAAIGTDRCQLDTDGDSLSDFWEYQSALDLNLRALPYPGKRPYPNALFADQNVDYDGDGMLAWQEHAMWVRFAGGGTAITYSDGTQTTDPASGLTDDLRDVDADGLPNQVEANGAMLREWWKTFYDQETLYAVEYADPDFLDADSDGDGRVDGEDDLDHDGYVNADDYDRSKPLPDKYNAANPWRPRWVQPHNPCLPDPESLTCSLYIPPLDDAWAPFKELNRGPRQIPIDDDLYVRPLTWPPPPALPAP
ncbi:MAG TPA: hypothetical protein VGW75_14490 [Solirubrobacteraceae bacterium]|nr:hypothetical protein [Solirubrobacteraceae bacterium]